MNKTQVITELEKANISWSIYEEFMSDKIPRDKSIHDEDRIHHESDIQKLIKICSLPSKQALEDTKLLFIKFSQEEIDKSIALRSNKDYAESLANLSFDKGRKLFLEVEITDTFMSQMIMTQMYSKSTDGTNGMHSMGMKINTIHFDFTSLAGFTENETQLLKQAAQLILYKTKNHE